MKKTLKMMMILIVAAMMTFVVATPAQAASSTKSVALKSVSLSSKSLTLNKGKSKTLTVTLNPTNTTVNKKVTWTSSNASVASVNKNGKITAKAPGSAVITAKVGGKTVTCKVTVKAPVTTLNLSATSTELEAGKSVGLTASFAPANTTDPLVITWTSSNEKVATVKNGCITGKAAGTATITAKMGNVTTTCKVTVKAGATKFVDSSDCYKLLANYRKSAKVGALKVDATLEKVAQTRAKELVQLYSHKRPNGESGLTLIKGNVYKGENIAMGQKTCADVMSAWFNSASHKANMLGANYTKVGVAGYIVNNTIYWVMVFSS